jgi:hypothetical protein
MNTCSPHQDRRLQYRKRIVHALGMTKLRSANECRRMPRLKTLVTASLGVLSKLNVDYIRSNWVNVVYVSSNCSANIRWDKVLVLLHTCKV